jgi:hypothetical protein
MSFPGTYNINYYYGDTLEFRVFPKNSSGEAFNLTSFTSARFTIAPNKNTSQQISCFAQIDPDKTNILCTIRPTDAVKLTENADGTFPNHVYDIEISKSGTPYDTVYTLLNGTVSITRDVTKPQEDVEEVELPDNPTNLVLDSSTENSLSVSWTEPVSGGAVAIYKVAAIPFTTSTQDLQGAINQSTLSVLGGVTTYTFTGLAPGTEYSVIVRSSNSGGDANIETILFNETAFTTQAPPPEVPDAPVINSINALDSALEVFFTPGADNGAEILNYQYSTDGTNYVTLSPSQTDSPLVITSLMNEELYSVTIKAINSVGVSLASNSVSGTPTASTIPNAPVITSINELDSSLGVVFSVSGDGGEPVTNYKYSLDGINYILLDPPQIKPTSVTLTVTVQNIGGANRYVIDGVDRPVLTLYRGVTYTFDQSDPSNATHPIYLSETNDGTWAGGTEYTVGTSYTGTAGTDGALVFEVPESSPSILYYVCVNHPGMGDGGNLSIEPFAIVLSGLTNGTTYPVTIKAVNIIGDSQASNSVSATPAAVIPPTVPEAPTISSIEPENESLVVNFTAGGDGNSAITNYKYSIDGTNYAAFDPAAITSPVTITGLTNGTPYSVTLIAVNDVGDSLPSNSVSATPEAPPEPDFVVTSSGTSAYLIDGVSNDTITLVRGETYIFEIDAIGHPFWIQTSSGAYNSANVLTTSDGVEGNGTEVGTITWTVAQSAPNTLYYVCQFHSSMQGTINIIDGAS